MSKAQVEVRTPVKRLSFWLSKGKLASKNICIEQQETVKEKQCNKERHKITIRDPQISMKYFIIFLNYGLQCAH